MPMIAPCRVRNTCLSFITLKDFLSLSDELVQEKEKYKSISDELGQTFAELTGY